MAQSFDILGGQYLEMIKFLRAAFTAQASDFVDVTLIGALNGKSNSLTLSVQAKDPYYVLKINDYKLGPGEESYANKPLPHPFSLTHIHGALKLGGPLKDVAEKKSFVALCFITSEAARFEPFSNNINTLIKDGDGSRVLDYKESRFYMNNWKDMFEWTYGQGSRYFKPLTAANMHNWNYHYQLIRHKTTQSMHLSFAETQDSLRPKPLVDL